MSSDIVIRAENLAKRYALGRRPRHDTLRDALTQGVKRLVRFGRSGTDGASGPDDFWALRGVSFEVRRGEVVGVIGRNGAGKSTLLKILSRITEPTEGTVTLRGRVASLLEVGTGFHPELSGRENVYLNGAILGMSRAEIRRKFDEIVAFAEVEQFLDTPVKHYSSGMYVRLAFAVAAHLEPEILIVDEVLAVGDLEFQRKCLGKMEQVAGGGRTVLFVSHNMLSIQQLCSRAVHLHDGRVLGDGPPLEQIHRYVGAIGDERERARDLSRRPRPADLRHGVSLQSAELGTPGAPAPWKLPFGAPLQFRLIAEVRSPLLSCELGIGLFNLQGLEIVSALSSWQGELGPVAPGRYAFAVDYGVLELAPGSYRFGVGVRSERGIEDYVPEAFEIEVVPSPTSQRPNLTTIRGAIARSARYTLERL